MALIYLGYHGQPSTAREAVAALQKLILCF
jgi:hypothetical protein